MELSEFTALQGERGRVALVRRKMRNVRLQLETRSSFKDTWMMGCSVDNHVTAMHVKLVGKHLILIDS
uniref:Uncharacterized protein n=1 Tax=Setaria digitata TaxID=48799 RepID=A0A915PFM5_9BILA